MGSCPRSTTENEFQSSPWQKSANDLLRAFRKFNEAETDHDRRIWYETAARIVRLVQEHRLGLGVMHINPKSSGSNAAVTELAKAVSVVLGPLNETVTRQFEYGVSESPLSG